MTFDDYEKMSHQILIQHKSITSTMMVIIADHNRNHIVKYQANDYTILANPVYQDMGNIIQQIILVSR
jgi:hypothetical protein